MLNCVIGSSKLADGKRAAIEAAQQVKAGLDEAKLVFAYASVDYNLTDMMAGLTGELPGVPVIGNTSFTGVVTPEGYVGGDSAFLGLMTLGGDEITVGVAGCEKGSCARETGKKTAEAAMAAAGMSTAPDYFYMVASSGQEETFLKGISDVIGRVPFFGGSAADNTISGDWQLYTDGGVFADGVAVAFFYGGKPITNLFTGAYRETGNVGIITKVRDSRVLAEIDGEPALKKYAAWAGVEANSLKGDKLLAYTVTSPLGIKDCLGDLTVIRHPMNGNDDYSMNIGNDLAEGTAVLRMEATVDELIASASETLTALKEKCTGTPVAYHLVHCGGRRAGIDSRIGEVAEGVKRVADGVPFIMEFTFGEYGYKDDGRNTCGGLMLSYTAFCK